MWGFIYFFLFLWLEIEYLLSFGLLVGENYLIFSVYTDSWTFLNVLYLSFYKHGDPWLPNDCNQDNSEQDILNREASLPRYILYWRQWHIIPSTFPRFTFFFFTVYNHSIVTFILLCCPVLNWMLLLLRHYSSLIGIWSHSGNYSVFYHAILLDYVRSDDKADLR